MSSALALGSAAAVTLAGVSGLSTWAALSATSQLFGPILIAPRRPREILLTFDDGPNPVATPRLLEVLDRHNVPATFFLIGNFARQQQALVREIARAGHTIGNHTETHPWLHLLPDSRIRAELAGCNAALEDILGAPVRLFRPPHGARRPAVLRVARQLGLVTVNWNVIVWDWKPATPAELERRLLAGIARNRHRGRASNLVLHDGGDQSLSADRLCTVEAVDRLLCTLAAQAEPPVMVRPELWLDEFSSHGSGAAS